MRIVAPAFQGAKKLDQACLAQPGEEMLRWTSPGLQAEPEHGREVADRIARVAVQHELGPRRRARGEIEQQRIVGRRRAVGREIARRDFSSSAKSRQPGGALADRDAHGVLAAAGEFVGLGAVGDDEAGASAREAVVDVRAAELRRRGDHDEAELHRRQRRDPQRRNVAEHQQQPVAALGAERAQAVGDARGGLGKFGESVGLDVVAENFQRRRAAVSPLASSASNQSSAQLKRSSFGQSKRALAAE